MIPVVVRHRAEADVEKARAWHAGENQRLGLRFAQEFRRTVGRIASPALGFYVIVPRSGLI